MSDVKITTEELKGPFWFGKVYRIELKSGVKTRIMVPYKCTLKNIYDIAESICDNIEEMEEAVT